MTTAPTATTKNKIITAGKKLFGTQGFVGTSMSDIAKEVGITKASLYYFYKNKQDLYLTVLSEVHQQIEALFANTTPQNRSTQNIEGLVLQLIDIMTSCGALLDVINPTHFDVTDPAFQQVFAKELMIEKKNRAYLKSCGVTNTKLASHTLFTATQGYALRVKYGVDDIKPKQFARYIATIIST